jgi:hypothetical protein
MKKEATPKRKGLRKKTSDEKRGNPKCKGLKRKKKISDEKRGNPKRKGLRKKKISNEKRGNLKT